MFSLLLGYLLPFLVVILMVRVHILWDWNGKFSIIKLLKWQEKKISAFIKIDQSLTNIQQLWCSLPNNLHVTNCVCQLKACVLLFVCSDVYGLVLVLTCGNCLMCRLLCAEKASLSCICSEKHFARLFQNTAVTHEIHSLYFMIFYVNLLHVLFVATASQDLFIFTYLKL